ncbi:oxygen-independent coproporphyrinogen III oxidase (plasmid) [Pedobacter sp. BS3]|uniref:oxygen-independent coproporphyrinogen III oxidase n=1 Tax=Pedobacter sp. BS3 TaxID=2567937 RepID=UPI0011EC2241|nr:oxygen-independent coproporphyrinogen III oxidase [Pedobacter sp. BS3]TZF86069.1 oxygen-independent coproporphyrinogen III oxidase [Pedobacter sp. BS3]
MDIQHLINKYHVAAPRYTSYPTVPYWNTNSFSTENWLQSVQASFSQSNLRDGISLYIHLPFCENLCTYCGCNTRITKNHRVEEPYIQAVLKEWNMYCTVLDDVPRIKEIHLGGGTPTFFSPQNLQLLIEGILNRATVHPDAEFSFEAHPANTTLTHLETLYQLGFRRLSLGIQDFDPKVQFIINRMQSYEQVKRVTEHARTTGYSSVNYDLIYGLPLQTLNGMEDTLEKVSGLMPDRIAFYSYAHVPWIKPGQRRFTEQDLPSPAVKRQLYELGRSVFTTSGYEEIGMDHFALLSDSLYQAAQAGTLHRNFMGYTHQYTQLMLALGVSSISDTSFAFAQNVKQVEEYIDLIDKNIFPVFKGHLLSAEDRMIRGHVLNIMCKGQTSWTDIDITACPALLQGLERMHALEEDGLVVLDRQQCTLWVTDTGKRFLRNICMALDARLWEKQPGTQIFSYTG